MRLHTHTHYIHPSSLPKLVGLLAVCVLLGGCPTASNPTTPQPPTPPPSSSPPTPSAAGEDTENTTGEGTQEPGFGDSGQRGDAGGMPDLSDEPPLEDAMVSFEDATGESEPGGSSSGIGGPPAGSGHSMPEGSAASGDTSRLPPGLYGTGASGSGTYGSSPLTSAEQVAILDAQLERGKGEFDAMILEEQIEQRRVSTENFPASTPSQPSGVGSSGSAYEEGGIADAGASSTGGGMGGVSGGVAGIPKNTAQYPPPDDLLSGNGDDVVARQLREAALHEPDLVLREKLWDEYRKYKGIGQ